MDNIKIIGDKVLVLELDSGEKKTVGGLILAKKSEPGENKEGIIVKRGDGSIKYGKWFPVNENLEVGKKVTFNYYGDDNRKEFLIDGKRYLLVMTDDVNMVV